MTLLRRAIRTALKAPNAARPPASVGAEMLMGAFGGVAAGGQLAQMSAYGSVGWLLAVVNRITSAVAAAEWRLYRRLPNGERREVHDHPLLSLWRP